MFEVEQKFKIDDSRSFRQRLEQLGATFGETIQQRDHYYAHPCRDFAETDEALRIRQVGNENRVTYKGPKVDQSTKTRREIELPFASGEDQAAQFGALLDSLGFTLVATVRKTRRPAELLFQQQSFEIALDDVEKLGTFIELELTADESQLDEARGHLADLAATLQLHNSESRSYLELLLQSAGDFQ